MQRSHFSTDRSECPPTGPALTPITNSSEDNLISAISPLFANAPRETLNLLAASVFRVALRLPAALTTESDALLSISNTLAAAGAQPDAEQLQNIYRAALLIDEEAVSEIRRATPISNPITDETAEILHRWNDDAAATFEQIALTSRAATRHADSAATPQSSTPSSQPSSSSSPPFSPAWLRLRCSRLAAVQAGNLSPSEMTLSVHTLLADRSMSDDAIQGHLFDAFAGDFEAVVDVIAHRSLIQKHADAILADCNRAAELEVRGVQSHEAPLPRGRGVSSRSGRRGDERDRMTAQVTIRNRAHEALQKEQERETRRLVKAGLISSSHDQDLDALPQQPDWGASAYLERQRAFPGVRMEGDSVIGEVDRVGLPQGSTRELGRGYEEIFVPPPSRTVGSNVNPIEIASALADHPELLQAMKGVTRLNRLQSAVYPVAFGSDENLLVCAPTGAGKTNVALLTIMREIVAVKNRVQRSFKVVYVAPMKALAAEVTEKFSRRLAPLGLRVREFTGDMSLSRLEALETHVLVTTPEKWDVVTRKSGSDLGDAVTLFIIDEIHLLHDDRGAVLESIVARTLRLSETAQRQIRLVGLSATLPNYADVGSFMRVNPSKGLFHFDGSHRPVPLSQTFIGISEGGSSNSNEARRRRENKMHELAWKKVKDSLQRGHQAMIFVHSRKRTGNAAREMLSRAAQDNCEDLFLGGESGTPRSLGTTPGFVAGGEEGGASSGGGLLPSWAAKEISKSKTADIRELCSRGVGIHNAGLPRPDRKLVEKLFAEGVIRLLCSTATLAWGVNLPARTVVIMGTEVYDAEKGGFVQLGMLDVTQIFGRAGRPQFDTEGEGTIITMHEHLGKYLSMLTSSIPIESKLGASASRLADHLNAEIVSGTVSSVGEGVRWLSYTYLSVRMPQNPLVYGIDWAEVEADSGLHSRRATLIEQAAKALDDARMCRYDPRTGVLSPTDLGRVSSHFYVSHETIVLWNELFERTSLEPAVTEKDWEETYAIVFHAVSCATEFEQMRSREEESNELEYLTRNACPVPLKAGGESREGKVAILLQAYISRAPIAMSDLSYVVQSATRLLRAFFEISLRRGFPSLSLASLQLARASESRIWPFQHALWQFTYLARREKGLLIQPETIATIEGELDDSDIRTLREMTKEDLSSLIRAPKMALTVQRVLNSIPILEIEKATIAPLSRTVLSIQISLSPRFRWNDTLHGKAESWWLWVEDQQEDRVYHSQKVLLTKRQVQSLYSGYIEEPNQGAKRTIDFTLTVPVFDPPSSQYWIRIESDRWHTGRGSSAALSLSKMKLPQEEKFLSQMIDLRPLSVRAVLPPEESFFFAGMTHFTPAQTQLFHVARHTNENMFVSAPTGSAEWVTAVLTILWALQYKPLTGIAYIVPDRETLRIREKELLQFERIGNVHVEVLGIQHVMYQEDLDTESTIILATPERWCEVTRYWSDEFMKQSISLVILEGVHMLSEKHNVGIELIGSRFRRIACLSSSNGGCDFGGSRIVGISEMLPNSAEVAEWLGVSRNQGLFSFGHNIREVPCESHVVGVAGDRYSSRMHSMNRPLFSMMERYSAKKPVLIYVSSRRQALLTAQDLIRLAAMDGRQDGFLEVNSSSGTAAIAALRKVRDMGLRRSLSKGIAIYHDSISDSEQAAVEALFRSGYARVLIATFKMARHLHVRCHQVIIKGTEIYDPRNRRYEDISLADVQHMIGHAGRADKDSTGYAVIFVHEPKKTLMKKFLHEPLPLESSLLHADLCNVLLRQICAKKVASSGDALEWLSWTLFFRRLDSNPGFYGFLRRERTKGSAAGNRKGADMADQDRKLLFCKGLVMESFKRMVSEGSIVVRQGNGGENMSVSATALGVLAISHGVSLKSVRGIYSKANKCEKLEDVADVLSACDELVDLECNLEEERSWRSLGGIVLESAFEAGRYANQELARSGLKVAGWVDSSQKRAKLLFYSLLVDARARVDMPPIDRYNIFNVVSRLIRTGIEVAAESGSFVTVKEHVRAAQCVYQGIFPNKDIWYLCGCENQRLRSVGIQAGWSQIEDCLNKEKEFSIFLAKNCSSEAERNHISRWLMQYPRLSLRVSISYGERKCVQVELSVRRKVQGGREATSLSRVSHKKEGGFAVVVSDAANNQVLCFRRLAEPLHRADGRRDHVLRLSIPLVVQTENVRVWVASDVHVGVEAEALISLPTNGGGSGEEG